MIPRNRNPPHPGEILRREFLEPMEMPQTALADKLGIPRRSDHAEDSAHDGVTHRPKCYGAGEIAGMTYLLDTNHLVHVQRATSASS